MAPSSPRWRAARTTFAALPPATTDRTTGRWISPATQPLDGDGLVDRRVERHADDAPDRDRIDRPRHAPSIDATRRLGLGAGRLAVRAAGGARRQRPARDGQAQRVLEGPALEPRRQEPGVERVARAGRIDGRRPGWRRRSRSRRLDRSPGRRPRRTSRRRCGGRRRPSWPGLAPPPARPRSPSAPGPRGRSGAGRRPRPPPRRTRRPTRPTRPSSGRGWSSRRPRAPHGTAPAARPPAPAGGSSSPRGRGGPARAGRPARRRRGRRRSCRSRSGSPGPPRWRGSRTPRSGGRRPSGRPTRRSRDPPWPRA